MEINERRELLKAIFVRRQIAKLGPSHPDWYEGMEADTEASFRHILSAPSEDHEQELAGIRRLRP